MSQAVANDKANAPSVLDRMFALSKSGSNLRTEFVAGLTIVAVPLAIKFAMFG
jgi:xanthine/uracil/vitamin C permease (AzgA family)